MVDHVENAVLGHIKKRRCAVAWSRAWPATCVATEVRVPRLRLPRL